MKKSIAKALRHEAEKQTIGKAAVFTRQLYRRMKANYKEENKAFCFPKLKLSKRAERRLSLPHF